jgi:hypothetical protein
MLHGLDPGSCGIVPRQRDPSRLCSGDQVDFDIFAAAARRRNAATPWGLRYRSNGIAKPDPDGATPSRSGSRGRNDPRNEGDHHKQTTFQMFPRAEKYFADLGGCVVRIPIVEGKQ